MKTLFFHVFFFFELKEYNANTLARTTAKIAKTCTTKQTTENAQAKCHGFEPEKIRFIETMVFPFQFRDEAGNEK